MQISVIQKIHLKVFGYYKIGRQYYVNCPTHGNTLAYSHGYENLSCLKCMEELNKDSKYTLIH